jgi:hypothetical protein
MDQTRIELLKMLNVIVEGAITIASILLPILVHKAIRIAQSKANLMKNEELKAETNRTLDDLDDKINTNIINAEKTLKPTILAAIADGKVDKTELKNLNGVVLDQVLNQLSADVLGILKQRTNDISGYISSRIEKNLDELKNAPGDAVQHTIIPEVKSTEKTTDTTATTEIKGTTQTTSTDQQPSGEVAPNINVAGPQATNNEVNSTEAGPQNQTITQ